MDAPLVSVILPVYNGERMVAESIHSVLQQDYRPAELIVIDDGSTDGTAGIAAAFADRVRYYYQPHSGAAAARNFGIRQAKGEYIAFIDADDLWPPGKLRFQMRCFEARPAIEIVQGLIRRIKIPDLVQGRLTGADIDFPFLYTNLGAMLVRRAVFDELGYLDEGLQFNEDTDFWLRAREAGIRIVIQRKVSLIYRIHGHNLTTGENLKTMKFFPVLQRSIHRRRSSPGSIQRLARLPFLSALPGSAPDQDTPASEKSQPLVSVILCIGGHQAEAPSALESIRRQDYPRTELLIVGPNCRDLDGPGLDDFERIEWIEHPSQEGAAQLNAAIKKCTGELVAFLMGDGQWTSGKIKSQLAYLLEHPAHDYVVGRTRQILEPGTPYSIQQIDGLHLRKNLRDQLGSLMVRRSALQRVGEFRLGLHGMEETDWFLRAKDCGLSKGTLPAVLLYQFLQPDAPAEETEVMKSALLQTIRASVHRKRMGGE